MPPSHIVCVGDIPLLHRRGCSSSPRLVQPLRKVVFFLPWKSFTVRCRSAVSDGDVSLKAGSHYCKYSGGTRPAAWKTHFPNTALLLAADLFLSPVAAAGSPIEGVCTRRLILKVSRCSQVAHQRCRETFSWFHVGEDK